MGIQINGQNDNISATDGGLTISDLEINQSGISTFNENVIINAGKLRINPAIGNTSWQRENKHMHQIRDDVYVEGTVNLGDKAGFDATPLGITTFAFTGIGTTGELTVGIATTTHTPTAHAIAEGKNILIKDSASGFQEAYNTLTGSTGLTIKVARASDPSSDLSIANTKVVVYTPADPRGCLNVAKDYAKFEENTFNPILRGFVGASTTHPVGINTEVFKIELKRDNSTQDSVATLLHSTREMGSKQRLALTIDDGDSYPDGKSLVLTQTGVKITTDDSDFSNANALLEVDGDVSIADKIIHTGDTNTAIRFPAADTVSIETAGSERLRITSTGIVVTGNGTAPNSTDVGSIFMPGGGDLGWLTSSGSITFNAYYNGGWKYVTSGTSHILWASSEGFNFSTASSGSADGTISYSRAMKIFTNNRVSIGDGNSGTPLGALHINTKSTMGTDTALWIGDNANKRYMAINQVSNSEMFSEMKLQYNDNGTRPVLKLSNPYAPAGYGTAILWQGYNDGQQGMILCQSENANSAAATMYLNSSSGTFLQGNSSRHVTMPQQPSCMAYNAQGQFIAGGAIAVFNSTRFNIGGHYNTSNGRFTAPTTGRYLVAYSGLHDYQGQSNAGFTIRLNGSDFDGGEAYDQVYGTSSSEQCQLAKTLILNMSANDYVQIYIRSSGTQVHQRYGSFSVCLLT